MQKIDYCSQNNAVSKIFIKINKLYTVKPKPLINNITQNTNTNQFVTYLGCDNHWEFPKENNSLIILNLKVWTMSTDPLSFRSLLTVLKSCKNQYILRAD